MTDTSAKIRFKQRVRDWATKLDIRVVWLGVRPMQNKWASCSTEGFLNKALISREKIPISPGKVDTKDI